MSESLPPRLAATVVPIRNAAGGLEVLLLQRARRDGTEGAWVFPGGRVEPAEEAAHPGDALAAARLAAVRETREEAGIELAVAGLGLIARWITPPVTSKRFDTWFFLTTLGPDCAVRVDGSEIHTHRWLAPAAALEAHRRREIRLPPPTFVTLSWLTEHGRVEAARAALVRDRVSTYEPRIHAIEAGACILYPGDAGYADGDIERPGARNRLWALADGYRYERRG